MLEKKTRVFHLARTLCAALSLLGGGALMAGCLDRPAVPLEPNTSSVFVSAVPTRAIDKIDLVFMIDNSISMGDKQEILRQAVPNLLRRLIQPDCLNGDKEKVEAQADGTCPAGSKWAFLPIKDIHIATITSALGAHGGDVCSASTTAMPNVNDFARLLPTVRPAGDGVPDPDRTGFLAWHGGSVTERETLITDFGNQVVAAGQKGCGFEASLESWYRFLVDPNPPLNAQISRVGDLSVRTAERDEKLLSQRRAFLRSDSLVAIIMLSDENDCSIADEGIGWTVTSPESKAATTSNEIRYKAASEACDTNPNDRCCYSCFGQAPEGCTPSPRCAGPNEAKLPAELDRREVRCAEQKRRFGMDMLWPVQRYIDGLTKPQVVDAWDPARPLVQNELFMARGDAGPRDPSLVVLAGIVGVPWQDIATPESLTGGGLEYLEATQIPWDVVLGKPDEGIAPSDPLMIESITPRTGLAAPGSWANPINGNEQDTSVPYPEDELPSNDDLQYACVFALPHPIDCSLEENEQACDCASDTDLAKKKPLCQKGPGEPQGHTQYHAKAYPGTRFLEVLKGIGDKAIVASICPKNQVVATDLTNPNLGYNPAVEAIIARLSKLLGGQCLPTELDVNPETGVQCIVVEAATQLGDPSCARAGRLPVSPEVARAVRQELRDKDGCDGQTGVDCMQIEMCGIRQLVDPDDKQSCFYDEASTVPGFCYIDPAKGEEAGGRCENGQCENPFVADKCPPEQQRILRFVGTADEPIPYKNATMLTVCVDD